MGREIRFRAWVKEVYEDGEFAYGGYMIEADCIKKITLSNVSMLMRGPQKPGIEYLDRTGAWMIGMGTVQLLSMDEIELMQWTGMQDKNGSDIYEGDICRNPSGEIGIITYGNGMYVSQFVPPYDWDAMAPYDGRLDQQEVLGNVYEHKHLLEEVTVG